MRILDVFFRTYAKLFLCMLLTIVSFTAQADDVNLNANATKSAIESLKNLEEKIPPLIQNTQRINFGPFQFSGSCGYDSHWYCFGNCMKENWRYRVSFGPAKDLVVQAYENLKNVAHTFTTNFSPTKSWLLTELPAMSAAFKNASSVMDKNVSIYVNPKSTTIQKKDATDSIIIELDSLIEKVNLAKYNLLPAVSGISSFDENLLNAFSEVKNSQSNVNRMFTHAEGQVNKLNLHCGKGDVMNNLNSVENSIRNQLNAVNSEANNTGVEVSTLSSSASQIIGSLVNIQQKINGVVTNIKNGKLTPTGVVQELHLKVAQSNWEQLAEYANNNL